MFPSSDATSPKQTRNKEPRSKNGIQQWPPCFAILRDMRCQAIKQLFSRADPDELRGRPVSTYGFCALATKSLFAGKGKSDARL